MFPGCWGMQPCTTALCRCWGAGAGATASTVVVTVVVVDDPSTTEELLLNRDGSGDGHEEAEGELSRLGLAPQLGRLSSPAVLGLLLSLLLSCLLKASRKGSCGTMTRLGTSTRALLVVGSCAGELSLVPRGEELPCL